MHAAALLLEEDSGKAGPGGDCMAACYSLMCINVWALLPPPERQGQAHAPLFLSLLSVSLSL